MNKRLAERAIILNRPGEPFVLGENTQNDEVVNLNDLDWQASSNPPTWDDVVGWVATLQVEDEAGSRLEQFQQARASADLQVTENMVSSLPSPGAVAVATDALHQQALQGIANYKSNLAAWPTMTDAQKLSHVEGLMEAMVGVLQFLTGHYS